MLGIWSRSGTWSVLVYGRVFMWSAGITCACAETPAPGTTGTIGAGGERAIGPWPWAGAGGAVGAGVVGTGVGVGTAASTYTTCSFGWQPARTSPLATSA